MSVEAITSDAVLRFEEFRLDPRGGLSRRHESGEWTPIALGSRAVDLLRALVERRGDLATRQALMDAAWPGVTVEDGNLAVQISTLRRVLDEDRSGTSCIQTVIGRGYRFLPVVASWDAESAASEASPSPGLPGPGHASASRPRLSLVVLPFKNASDNFDGGSLAETITDDLAIGLSGLSCALVIDGKAAGSHERAPSDARQAGLDLGVNYVIRGNVRVRTDRTDVAVQLIDVETGAYVWADRFDTDHRLDADSHGEMVSRLTCSLARKLIEDVNRRIEILPPADWSVYDLNMQGDEYMRRTETFANRQLAINSYERALHRDPGSAAARIGIANVLIGNILNGWTTSNEGDMARAEQLLLEARQGETDIIRARTVMGELRRLQGRLSESRLELEIAIEMSPNFGHANGQLGMTLLFLGQPEDAIPCFEKSLRLAPHDQASHTSQAALGLCHLMLGEIEIGVTWLRKGLAHNTHMYYICMWLAAGLGLNDALQEAAVALRQAIEITPEICSLTALRARWRMMTNSPRFFELAERTIVVGLRRAGLPE